MKFVINQKAFVSILEKGALAALSDSAQEELSAMAPLFKSVKIEIKGQQVIVSSASRLLYTEYVYTCKNEDGAENKEDGVILVAAKELLDWAKKQPESKIGINFEADKTVQTLSLDLSNDKSDKKSKDAMTINKLGTVRVVSKDISKTGSKWTFDCYDPSQVTWVHYPEDHKIFTLPFEQFKTALPYASLSCIATHNLHIYDAIVFQSSDDKLYMLSSDNIRCSFYQMSKASNIKMDNMIVIPQKVLATLVKQMNPSEDIHFYNSDKLKKVVVKQSDYTIGIVMPDQNIINQYVYKVKSLIVKKYIDLAKIPKTVLKSRLETSAIVNNSSVLFYFMNNPVQLILHAIPENGKSPHTCNTLVKDLIRNERYVWNPRYVIDFIKVMHDDDIVLHTLEVGRATRLTSAIEPLFEYHIINIKIEKTSYNAIAF